MSEKHDFNNTVRHKIFNLPENLFRFPAPLAAAHIRHDTVRTEVITAIHDIHARLKRIFSDTWQIFHNSLCLFPDIQYHTVGLNPRIKQFCQLIDIMRTKNKINKRITFLYFFYNCRLLHHTATHGNFHRRVFLLLIFHISQSAVNFQIGIFTDRTGIIKDKVRHRLFDRLIANIRKNGLQFFRISGIHLTSHRLHRKRQFPAKTLFFLCCPFFTFFHKIILTQRLLIWRLCVYIHSIDLFIIKHYFLHSGENNSPYTLFPFSVMMDVRIGIASEIGIANPIPSTS